MTWNILYTVHITKERSYFSLSQGSLKRITPVFDGLYSGVHDYGGKYDK